MLERSNDLRFYLSNCSPLRELTCSTVQYKHSAASYLLWLQQGSLTGKDAVFHC